MFIEEIDSFYEYRIQVKPIWNQHLFHLWLRESTRLLARSAFCMVSCFCVFSSVPEFPPFPCHLIWNWIECSLKKVFGTSEAFERKLAVKGRLLATLRYSSGGECFLKSCGTVQLLFLYISRSKNCFVTLPCWWLVRIYSAGACFHIHTFAAST